MLALLFTIIAPNFLISINPVSGDALSDRFRALKFSDSRSSYINFVPSADMSVLKYRASVCAWLKGPGGSSYPVVFSYNVNNFRFSGKGSYHGVAASYFPTTVTTASIVPFWHHACVTFGASAAKGRYYVNGKLIAEKAMPGPISSSNTYKVTVGNLTPGHSSYYYGGEVVGLNVYSKELTAAEVAEMHMMGLCSLEPDQHDEARVVTWEEILRQTRTGSVSEFTPTNCTRTKLLVSELSQLRRQVTSVNQTREELQNTTAACLETKAKLNVTQEKLAVSEEKLRSCNTTGRARWDWNIFSRSQFINQTITAEMTRTLTSSWDGLGEKMIGLRITDRWIEFLKIVDVCSEDRMWETLQDPMFHNKVMTEELAENLLKMWDGISDKLIGIKMTPKVIELLKYIQDTS